jgi:hypothetical protein
MGTNFYPQPLCWWAGNCSIRPEPDPLPSLAAVFRFRQWRLVVGGGGPVRSCGTSGERGVTEWPPIEGKAAVLVAFWSAGLDKKYRGWRRVARGWLSRKEGAGKKTGGGGRVPLLSGGEEVEGGGLERHTTWQGGGGGGGDVRAARSGCLGVRSARRAAGGGGL